MALGPEQLRQLDEEYRPPAPFAAWLAPPIDVNSWERYKEALDKLRRVARQSDDVERSLRAAALNTGAIEGLHGADRGLTVTVVEAAAEWQAHVERVEGAGARELVAAAFEGYEMALDIATRQRPVTEVWLRQVHAVVCRPQQTYRVRTPLGWQDRRLELGEYKSQANHVELANGSLHAYAPVGATPVEMRRLVDVLLSDELQQAHPVRQAAFAHHAFTVIHPFADGNGRVARILASVYLLRAASIPFVVYDDQTVSYLDALARADGGQLQPFLQFVSDRAIDQLAYSSELLRAATSDGALHGIEPAAAAAERVRLAATRLSDAAQSALDAALADLGGRSDLEVRRGGRTLGGVRQGSRAILRGLPQPSFEVLSVPYGIGASAVFAVVADPAATGGFPLGLWDGHDVLEVRLSDVDPSVAMALRVRLEARMRRAVQEVLEDLTERVRRHVSGA